MKLKFNDTEEMYEITSYRIINQNLAVLKGENLPQGKSCGFKLLRDDGSVSIDCSDYTVKFNVLTEIENVLMFSNSKDNIETEDNPAGRYCHTPKPEEIKEDVDPLTNEELTECVADLMYESSLRQLGL